MAIQPSSRNSSSADLDSLTPQTGQTAGERAELQRTAAGSQTALPSATRAFVNGHPQTIAASTKPLPQGVTPLQAQYSLPLSVDIWPRVLGKIEMRPNESSLEETALDESTLPQGESKDSTLMASAQGLLPSSPVLARPLPTLSLMRQTAVQVSMTPGGSVPGQSLSVLQQTYATPSVISAPGLQTLNVAGLPAWLNVQSTQWSPALFGQPISNAALWQLSNALQQLQVTPQTLQALSQDQRNQIAGLLVEYSKPPQRRGELQVDNRNFNSLLQAVLRQPPPSSPDDLSQPAVVVVPIDSDALALRLDQFQNNASSSVARLNNEFAQQSEQVRALHPRFVVLDPSLTARWLQQVDAGLRVSATLSLFECLHAFFEQNPSYRGAWPASSGPLKNATDAFFQQTPAYRALWTQLSARSYTRSEVAAELQRLQQEFKTAYEALRVTQEQLSRLATPADTDAPRGVQIEMRGDTLHYETLTLTKADLAALAGAQPGTRLTVTRHRGDEGFEQIYLESFNARLLQGSAVVVLRLDQRTLQPQVFIYDVHLRPEQQQRGLGFEMFSTILHKAQQLGIASVQLEALGSRDDMRRGGDFGYYAWARFGFDAPLTQGEKDRLTRQTDLPEAVRNAQSVQDLMQTPVGRLWWRDHGTARTMTFDVRSDSASWQQFQRYQTYLEQRRAL